MIEEIYLVEQIETHKIWMQSKNHFPGELFKILSLVVRVGARGTEEDAALCSWHRAQKHFGTINPSANSGTINYLADFYCNSFSRNSLILRSLK